MTKGVKIAIISVISAAIIGTAFYLYKQYKLLLDYCIKFNGLKINKVSLNLISLNLNLLFRNKSDITINVEKYNLQVFLNEKKVADLMKLTNQAVLKRSMSNISIGIYFNPKDFFTGLRVAELVGYFLSDTDKIVLKIVGTVDIKAGMIEKSVAINTTYTLTEIMKPADPNKVEEECKM